jgi:hypothetical protein
LSVRSLDAVGYSTAPLARTFASLVRNENALFVVMHVCTFIKSLRCNKLLNHSLPLSGSRFLVDAYWEYCISLDVSMGTLGEVIMDFHQEIVLTAGI